VPARDRIILDTGDGAAVTFMGDPEDALFASVAVRDHAGGVPIRLGVNLGPVRLVKDLNDQINIIGDGINVAQRVMSFARAGQLLVSRSFYEVVSCLSRDYARMFQHEGARTDKHVREHEVYSVVTATGAARRIGDTIEDEPTAPVSLAWLEGAGPLGLRRSAIAIASVVFLTLVAGGVGAGALMHEEGAPRVAAHAVSGSPVHRQEAAPSAPSAAPAPAAAIPAEKPAPRHLARLETKAERQEKAVASSAGRLELAVAPWGEVLIAGKRRGVSPPLRVVDLPPGAHTIEIRNSTFPVHVEKVELKAGESVRIRHRFK
jgi:hypothetical protein